MICYKCGKNIDLDMSVGEEKELQKQLDTSKVIMLCYECYKPLEDIITKWLYLPIGWPTGLVNGYRRITIKWS